MTKGTLKKIERERERKKFFPVSVIISFFVWVICCYVRSIINEKIKNNNNNNNIE